MGERETPAQARQQQGIKSRWSLEPDPLAIFHAVFAEAGAEENHAYVEAIDVSCSQVVADLGGGGGGLLSAILIAAPRLRGVLVDRPEAVEGAARRIETLGLQDRCEIRSGDLAEAAPEGADTYLMRSVLQGYDDDSARMILANCRAAIPDDGRLLVIESVMPHCVEAADAAVERLTMGDLNMLAVTGGRERTHAEWESLLNASGFDVLATRPVRAGSCESPTNPQHSVIEARPRR